MPLIYIGVFLASLSSFFGSIYIAQKATRAVGVSSVIGAVINIAVNALMIRWAGLYAASVSTIVSYLTLVLYRAWDIWRKGYAELVYHRRRIACGLGLIVISAALCAQRRRAWDIANLLLALGGFWLLNRRFLIGLWRGLWERLGRRENK